MRRWKLEREREVIGKGCPCFFCLTFKITLALMLLGEKKSLISALPSYNPFMRMFYKHLSKYWKNRSALIFKTVNFLIYHFSSHFILDVCNFQKRFLQFVSLYYVNLVRRHQLYDNTSKAFIQEFTLILPWWDIFENILHTHSSTMQIIFNLCLVQNATFLQKRVRCRC